MTPTTVPAEAEVDLEEWVALLGKYDRQAPRYTSYPPATHFTPDFDPMRYREMLGASNRTGPRNLSFYFHIPFCPKRCLFCGCNTLIAQPGSAIKDYFEILEAEMDLVLPLIDASRPVTQVHFGGGTPNAAPLERLSELVRRLGERFDFGPAAEMAMECDPSLLLPAHLERLRGAGFNRLSFGIQDVREDVLRCVNRRPSRIPPHELVKRCRDLGFSGINLDLICGLPLQTPGTFRETVETILKARPDRISVFSYAHVPWMMPHQKALEAFPMPGPADRARISLETRARLRRAGYVPIGLDHYVLPGDELAAALGERRLHRNFQGYCSQRQTGQVLAFGASAISQLHQGYGQNRKDLGGYGAAIQEGRLPCEKAYFMSERDILVRELIEELMCYGELRLDREIASFPEGPASVGGFVEDCHDKLLPFVQDGLLTRNGKALRVTERGLPALRLIAAALDPLEVAGERRYSRSI